MRSRARRSVVIGAASLAGLLAASAAWANPSMHKALAYPGVWGPLLIVVIVAIEGALLRWVGRFSWFAAYLTALLANLLSFLLAPRIPGGTLTLNETFFLTEAAILVETPVVLVARWVMCWWARPERIPQCAGVGRVLLAAVVMNLVSAPVLPVFEHLLPQASLQAGGCQTNLRQVPEAVLRYKEEHGKWPAGHNLAELEPLLLPYLGTRGLELLVCPGEPRGSFFPLPREPRPYACADFTRLPAEPQDPAQIPILWDSRPIHQSGYNVAYLDGHVKWSAEKPAGP
jgi:prepilin-type processing-associated H-X9-DG protein